MGNNPPTPDGPFVIPSDAIDLGLHNDLIQDGVPLEPGPGPEPVIPRE